MNLSAASALFDRRTAAPAATAWGDAGDRRWWWLAAIAMVGVLCPLFGRSVTLFGIHSRIVSFVLLGWAGVVTIRYVPARRIDKVAAVLLASTLVFMLMYATATQWENVFRPQFETNYYEGKLAQYIQFAVPLQIVGLLCSAVRNRPAFQRGLGAGILACGMVALAVFASDADNFLSQTYVMAHAFKDEQIFSTISMSILISLTAIVLLFDDRGGVTATAVRWTVFGLLLAPILLLRQRAHLVFIAILLMVRLFRGSLKAGQLIALVLVAWVMFSLFQSYSSELLGETVTSYWDEAFTGQLFDSRAPAYDAAMTMFERNPLGVGVGAFALADSEDRYPHNVVLEACVELGIFGGVAVALLYLRAVYRSVTLLLKKGASRYQSTMAGVVLFFVVHTLKAGDITGLGFLAFFMLIAPRDPKPAARGARPGQTPTRLIA